MSVSSAQPCLSDHDITQPGEVRPFKSGGSRQGKYLQVYRVYLLDTCANLLLDHVATIGFHSYRVGTINGFGDAVWGPELHRWVGEQSIHIYILNNFTLTRSWTYNFQSQSPCQKEFETEGGVVS